MPNTSLFACAYLPFEGELERLDEQVRKLEELARTNQLDMAEEIARKRAERDAYARVLYSKLTPWERVQVARHAQRPQTLDYVPLLCQDFIELHGDRCFADDRSIVTGLATIAGQRVLLVGQHKGRDTNERIACNFGYAKPEGFRKALWKMRLAEKWKLPLVCLVDTKGAAPDVGAEERGQSQAIAYNLQVLSALRVPVLCAVIGEGGSGGALGVGVGDRLLIQEFAYFSVISPEGCASILWKDVNKKEEAAAALKLTAPDLKSLGLVDEIVPEPPGGAQRDPAGAARLLSDALGRNLRELTGVPVADLVEARYQRLRRAGRYAEAAGVA